MKTKEELTREWTRRQIEIAKEVVLEDQNCWSQNFIPVAKLNRDLYIAGADVSFSKSDMDLAIGSFTVFILRKTGTIDLVLSRSQRVHMPHPYIPTFLGFREAPVIAEMIRDLPDVARNRIDCLLVDGNGVLHPRGAGLACQVGLEHDLPTVGVSKNLLRVDGLEEQEIRSIAQRDIADGVDVVGKSGRIWAKALITGNAVHKPIYVSVGHKVSLTTASRLVRSLCEFRVPAPLRAADMHSRAKLRGEDYSVFKAEEFLYNDQPIGED